jgi:hypothetical protein
VNADLQLVEEFMVAGGKLKGFLHAFRLAQVFTTTIDIIVGN